MKTRPYPTDVVPEFLHNSPFFIPEQHEFKADRRNRRKPTIKQILKSKQFRTIVYAILAIILFFYLKSKAQEVDLWGRMTGPSCYYSEPFDMSFASETNETDWSSFAYIQYATDTEYLCNSLMVFETLNRLGSKADRVLLYPSHFGLNAKSGDRNTELLWKAKTDFGVTLVPIEVQHNSHASYAGPNWSDSYTKLLAFNQTQYKRIIALDSDSTILETMDELFFLPPTQVAMPRAYWLQHPTMSSHIMLIQPSTSAFSLIEEAIKEAGYGIYDMEIVNKLFGNDCIRLPHRPYALLTGEFRSRHHNKYMDDPNEEWDADAAIMESKLVHFSDHPLEKPWLASKGSITNYMPKCGMSETNNWDCRARYIWIDLYEGFKERRKRVCGM